MRVFALLFVLLFSTKVFSQEIKNNITNKDSFLIDQVIKYVQLNYKEHLKNNISISLSKKTSHANINGNYCKIYLGQVSKNQLLENYEYNLKFILLHEIAHCILGNKIQSEVKYTKKMFFSYHETFADIFASTYFIKNNNIEPIFLLYEKRQLQYISKSTKNYDYYLFPYVFADFINKENMTFLEMTTMSKKIVENHNKHKF